ncbi:MAG: VOC family protein [Candidatus Dormibacteria bacterium]
MTSVFRDVGGDHDNFYVKGLLHVAIKCSELSGSIRFYRDVLGLHEIERPLFGYPGSWLATQGKDAIIHLYGGKQGLNDKCQRVHGSGSIDHVSLNCVGFDAFIKKLEERNIDWREFRVPDTDLYQVFCYDPSGVLLELTFRSSVEHINKRMCSTDRNYVAGVSFDNDDM